MHGVCLVRDQGRVTYFSRAWSRCIHGNRPTVNFCRHARPVLCYDGEVGGHSLICGDVASKEGKRGRGIGQQIASSWKRSQPHGHVVRKPALRILCFPKRRQRAYCLILSMIWGGVGILNSLTSCAQYVDDGRRRINDKSIRSGFEHFPAAGYSTKGNEKGLSLVTSQIGKKNLCRRIEKEQKMLRNK